MTHGWSLGKSSIRQPHFYSKIFWWFSQFSRHFAPIRLKVVKSKILDKRSVPKKGQSSLQYHLLTLIFMVRSVATKYLVIKDVIHTIEDFKNTISAHFKQEMFLSWAIDRNHIKHDFLLSLTNSSKLFLLSEIRIFFILTLLTVITCAIF